MTFILGTTNHLTLTDLIQDYSAYGTPVKAVFEVTDPDGILMYQNVGFGISDPPDFSSPDFNSGTGTWTVTGIDLWLDADGVSAKRGEYTVNAWYKCGTATPVNVVKTYNLDYVSPVVEIGLTASCRTSELTVDDNTNYASIGDSVPIAIGISRVETLTKPSGSGANTPAVSTTTTTTHTRTIGGGITAATRLWTRVWQDTIVTTLTYAMEAWGTYNWIIIQDVVSGSDYIDVQCTDCACVLNTCWENLITRWKDAEANYALNVGDLRYKVALGSALWTDFYNLERCGEDTTYKCLEIRDLLNSVDCSCVTNPDNASVEVVPWGSGTGTPSASTFAFTVGSTDPVNGTGASGDVYFQKVSKHLWNNVGGTWLDAADLSGSSGADGADAVPQTMFYNNSANVGTSAGITIELLDSILLSSPISYGEGDSIYCKAVFELALNDNGKTVSLYVNATKIVDYFTDSAVNATNNIVTIEAWINVTGTDTQAIETLVTRGGNTYPGFTTGTFDTSAGLTVKAYGQNSVATLNDIIIRLLKVEYKNQLQAL